MSEQALTLYLESCEANGMHVVNSPDVARHFKKCCDDPLTRGAMTTTAERAPEICLVGLTERQRSELWGYVEAAPISTCIHDVLH
jgi:hypothetical protein